MVKVIHGIPCVGKDMAASCILVALDDVGPTKPLQVYVVIHLPSGGKIELVMRSTDGTHLLHEIVRMRVSVRFVLHNRLRIFPKSSGDYMTKKGVLVLNVSVEKNNLWIGSQNIRGSFHFACDLSDARLAFTKLFDDFDGTFHGVIEPYKSGYRYLPPKGYQVLPWIALTGAVHYILAKKKQSLADVLVPSDDCELVGMTLVEKYPPSYLHSDEVGRVI
jgi:hypothetical protein